MTHTPRIALPVVIMAVATCLMAVVLAQTPSRATDVISVQAARPGAAISPAMFGVFFEDINFAADGGLDQRAGEVIVKIVNSAAKGRPVRIGLDVEAPRGTGRMIVLSSTDLKAENSLDQPVHVAPVDSEIALQGPELRLDLPPQSLTVLRLPWRR